MADIYKIVNSKNGKVYVGKTTQQIIKRWYRHVHDLKKNKHGNLDLQRDWNHFGPDAFRISYVCKEDSNNLESTVIYDLKSMDCDFGYNKTSGGERGFFVSNITRSRQSLKKLGKTSPNKGKKFSKEHCENLRNSHLGHSPTKETRLKLSLAAKEQWKRQKGEVPNC